MNKRKTKITRNYLMHPAGSVLIETGNTKVICTAMIEKGVPSFLKEVDPPQGWLTAEYSMLPGAPNQRFKRERGKSNSRSTEIQRLIGRVLRTTVDMTKFPGFTIHVDCDVIQADGGTRTAAITGACVAIKDAFTNMISEGSITEDPFKEWIAAVSVGMVNSEAVVDLCYEEDFQADVDMNIVMTESGKYVEIQRTGETKSFSDEELREMLKEAKKAIRQLIKFQKRLYEK
jgi:ribonuclease PH